jgi:hypothetical protein
VTRLFTAVTAAAAIAAVAFLFRFNTLGGTLGGFDNDEFAHLLRSDAILRGEQPLRDFADAELRGAWPSLSYAVPAWAQRLWGRNLLSEAYLTAGALACAYAVLFLMALDLSRWRCSAAILAALLAVATAAKLYNYPKVVMLALGAVAIRLVAGEPSAIRLAIAAAITAIATLFRHDYGVYLAIGTIAGIIARDYGQWRAVSRRIGVFAAVTATFLLPSIVWIQTHEGVVPYFVTALQTSGIESRRTSLEWPAFTGSALFDEPNLIAFTYYAFWAIPAVALLVLASRATATPAQERGTIVGLIALALIVNVFFLRSNLAARFGDAVVPTALIAAWAAGAASHVRTRTARVFASVTPYALLISMIPSAYAFGELGPDLRQSGLTSPTLAAARFRDVRASLAQLPPATLGEGIATGTLRAARYLSECTTPQDRVLVAAYAPELLVFARRPFAGGQPTVSLALYGSEEEQRTTLARWQRQSVPVIVATDEFEQEFVTDYPLLAKHVAERYHEAGAIPVGEDERFRVFVENDRPSRGIDPRFDLPCFR